MLAFRFLGIRARLLLLVAAAALAGGFAVVPLLPSSELARVVPRLGLALLAVTAVAALVGRGIAKPLDRLREVLEVRLTGKEAMPARDPGYDEVARVNELLVQVLEKADVSAIDLPLPPAQVRVDPAEGPVRLLSILEGLPGTGGSHQAVTRILDGLKELLRLDHASLLLRDGEDKLELVHAAGLNEALLADLTTLGPRPVRYAPGIGLAGAAIKEGVTKLAPKGNREKDFARLGGEFERSIKNLACVPLRQGGTVVGVLNAVNLGGAHGLTRGAVETLEAAARVLEGYLPALTGSGAVPEADPLTGSLVFAEFKSRLAGEIDRIKRWPRGLSVAVLKIAVPGPDPQGVERNRILVEVAGYIQEECRAPDFVGRDGNRFLIGLPETDVVGAIHLAGRIKDRIDRAGVREDGAGARFSGVVGVASVPETIDDPTRLVSAAEAALVSAQKAGDSRLVCFRRKAA